MGSTTLFDSPFAKATQAHRVNRFHHDLAVKIEHLTTARAHQQKARELLQKAEKKLEEKKKDELNSLNPKAALLKSQEKLIETYQLRLVELTNKIGLLENEIAQLKVQEALMTIPLANEDTGFCTT